MPHAAHAQGIRETARPINCPSSANSCCQCILELTKFLWLAQSDILALVCYTQWAWPQWGQQFPWIQLLGKVFLTRHLQESQTRRATIMTQSRCGSHRQCTYIHLPRARQENALKERLKPSYSEYGADIINLQLQGTDTISKKSPDKILYRHLIEAMI